MGEGGTKPAHPGWIDGKDAPLTKGRRAMEESDIQGYARQLFEAHGAKAVAEAAQKAAAFEQKGENEQAQVWRRIESALYQMLGPHQS